MEASEEELAYDRGILLQNALEGARADEALRAAHVEAAERSLRSAKQKHKAALNRLSQAAGEVIAYLQKMNGGGDE